MSSNPNVRNVVTRCIVDIPSTYSEATDQSHSQLAGGGGGTGTGDEQVMMQQHLGCEQFSAFNTCYHDTGLFGLYGACDPSVMKETIHELMFGVNRLSHSITDEEVELAKRKLRHMIVAGLDSTTSIAEDIGRQLLTYGRRISQQEMEYRINKVDANHIRKVARQYLHAKPLALTAMGPIQELPTYEQINLLNRMTTSTKV